MLNLSFWDIAQTVFLYLGVPFIAGFLSNLFLKKIKGEIWYDQSFIPLISPITLWALLCTIVLMFTMKGAYLLKMPFDVLHIAIPLILYFLLMFLFTFFTALGVRLPYQTAIALALTSTGNNFELAIAVAIGVFGLNSSEAFAGIVGPLIEVPVLLALVRLGFILKKKFYPKFVEAQQDQ
jgi:ACR3 family arsenite transporter